MSSNMGNPHENIFFVGKIIYKRVFLSSAIFDDWVIEIGKVRKDPADRFSCSSRAGESRTYLQRHLFSAFLNVFFFQWFDSRTYLGASILAAAEATKIGINGFGRIGRMVFQVTNLFFSMCFKVKTC